MKRSKLLTTLFSTSAIVAVMMPMAIMTSCNKNKTQVASIEATSKIGTTVFESVIITRDDINVVATKTDGTTEVVKDWTCSSFVDGKYIVTVQDVVKKTIAFEITYSGKTTSLIINVSTLSQVHFLFPEITLWKGENMSSEKQILLYAIGGLSPQLLSPKDFDLVYCEDDTPITQNPAIQVKQLGSTDKQLIFISGTVSGTKQTLKVYKKSDTQHINMLDEMTIKVTTDDLGASINEDSSATLTIKKGTKISEKGVVNIPEYIYSDGASHPVTNLTTEGVPSAVDTIIIPNTVTSIDAGTFNYSPTIEEAKTNGWVPLNNIYYQGTSEQWNNVSGGLNWQGKFAMGVYCSEDGKYINFSNCLNSRFDVSCKERENKPTLVAEANIGAAIVSSYYVKLDYSLITSGDASKYTYIMFINHAKLPIGGLGISVYLNGFALTKDTHYEIIDDEGRFGKTIKFKTGSLPEGLNLDKDSQILLDVTSPTFSKDSIWIGAFQPE